MVAPTKPTDDVNSQNYLKNNGGATEVPVKTTIRISDLNKYQCPVLSCNNTGTTQGQIKVLSDLKEIDNTAKQMGFDYYALW